MMKPVWSTIILAALAPMYGVPGTVSLKVADEVAPPGGVAQLKLFITEPTPISTGFMALDYDAGAFADVLGVALHTPSGDACGVAVVDKGKLQVRFWSPSRTFGMSPDYPALTIAVDVRPDALPGSSWRVNLNPASWYLDAFGALYAAESKPGSVTIGGAVSIRNVAPGGGVLPPHYPFQILGVGFQPGAKVSIDGIEGLESTFVSPAELRLSIAAAADLNGRRVRVKNRDGSAASYYSYLRGTQPRRSAFAWLQSAVPLYAEESYQDAGVAAPAVGLRNPNASQADLTITRYSVLGTKTGEARVSLAPWSELVRQFSELGMPSSAEPAAYFRITATIPIQVLGLAPDANGAALPVPAIRF